MTSLVESPLADRLLDVKRIHHEPDLERFPRARQVFDRLPARNASKLPRTKPSRAQLAAEIIFLNHNEGLHDVNSAASQGEELLWRPELQQFKRSENGQWNVRFESAWKSRWVHQLSHLVAERLPTCRISYAF